MILGAWFWVLIVADFLLLSVVVHIDCFLLAFLCGKEMKFWVLNICG